MHFGNLMGVGQLSPHSKVYGLRLSWFRSLLVFHVFFCLGAPVSPTQSKDMQVWWIGYAKLAVGVCVSA